jgi:hypothetical protein
MYGTFICKLTDAAAGIPAVAHIMPSCHMFSKDFSGLVATTNLLSSVRSRGTLPLMVLDMKIWTTRPSERVTK